jgi:undecaprenyl-diphosphatase
MGEGEGLMTFLLDLDHRLFLFLNSTISNPVGDVLWPVITDYDKILPVRLLLLATWVLLLWKGGRKGRTVAVMVIPLLFLTDRVTSGLLKEWFARPRPCHSIDGAQVVQGLHLLVDCGPGKSFPSSHAVNNFALGTLFSFYYRRWTAAFMAWAGLVGFSRIAVGVHFPLDVLGGAVIGVLLASCLIYAWKYLERRLPGPVGLSRTEGGL